jgi:hypothetical protein
MANALPDRIPVKTGTGKGKGKGSSKSKSGVWFGRARMGQAKKLGLVAAEIGGAAFLGGIVEGARTASGAGATINIPFINKRVDVRLLGAAGALTAGVWKKGKVNEHAINIGMGLLSAWALGKGVETGKKIPVDSAIGKALNVISGADDGAVGAIGKRDPQKRAERIQKRIAELQSERQQLLGQTTGGTAG